MAHLLSVEQAIDIAEAEIGKVELRDRGALESALFRPHVGGKGWGDSKNFPSQIANMVFAIATYHAFVDGNKRIANILAIWFLCQNGATFYIFNDELKMLILDAAKANNEISKRCAIRKLKQFFRAALKSANNLKSSYKPAID